LTIGRKQSVLACLSMLVCFQQAINHESSQINFRGVAYSHTQQIKNFVTYQATYTLAGPPELRWGNLKGRSA
jgi:hypothetical protein